jgi:hypothetical protein
VVCRQRKYIVRGYEISNQRTKVNSVYISLNFDILEKLRQIADVYMQKIRFQSATNFKFRKLATNILFIDLKNSNKNSIL